MKTFYTTIVLSTLLLGMAYLGAEELPKVVVFATGGTIAEKTVPSKGGAVPALSGQALLKAVPELSKIARIKTINFSNIDSSQMTPEIWAKLSSEIDKELENPDITGAIVVHGTDTMAEGAFFLDLTLKSDKPLAFVGAMRDASALSADGPANLLDAVTVVTSEAAKDWGVTIVMNQYINSARDVRKTNTTNVQTFESGEKGYLGYVQGGKVLKYHGRRKVPKFSIPEKLPKVFLLKTYAGDNGNLVRYAVDSGAKGIVIEGVGAGNVNSHVNDAINYALKKNIPVVLSTRVMHGGVFAIYADKGGGETLKKEGVILGGDLTSPKARILLTLALPHVNGDFKKLQTYFTY